MDMLTLAQMAVAALYTPDRIATLPNRSVPEFTWERNPQGNWYTVHEIVGGQGSLDGWPA